MPPSTIRLPPRGPGQNGRPRKKGARRPTLQHVLTDAPHAVDSAHGQPLVWRRNAGGARSARTRPCGITPVCPPSPLRWVLIRDPQDRFEPQALVTTHLTHPPSQMLEWFVRRWRMEVTFEEARAHLGIETQRQWNDWAIGRTTPALFGLYSLVALMAHAVFQTEGPVVRTAAWYVKERPTFSDALAVVRRELWSDLPFFHVGLHGGNGKNPALALRALNRHGLLCRVIG